jgi:hypothetical protein
MQYYHGDVIAGNRGNGRPFTDAERARIHEVSAATRRSGGSLTHAAEALAVELNRTPSAMRIQLATMRHGVIPVRAGVAKKQAFAAARAVSADDATDDKLKRRERAVRRALGTTLPAGPEVIRLPSAEMVRLMASDTARQSGVSKEHQEVHSKRMGQKPYTREQRARIQEVYAAARLSGVPLAQAAEELAAEMGRKKSAVGQQLDILRVREEYQSIFGPLNANVVVDTQEAGQRLQARAVDEAYREVCAGRQERGLAAWTVSHATGVNHHLVLRRFKELNKRAAEAED